MATRFYLPSSGTPPLSSLAVRSDWEQTTGLVRLPTKTTKQNTALTNSNRTWPSTSTQQWCWYQFQSEQLLAAYSWATTDTVSMVLGKLAETTTSGDTHLAYIIRVVSSDGTTERGVIGLYHATSTEFALTASAATRIHSARTDGATNFNSQIGDRIIIEIGVHGVTPAAESIQMRVGDPSATSDFALTAALTTDLCSWVELSRTVSLGTIVNIVPVDCENSSTIDATTITQTHLIAPVDSANNSTADNTIITQTHLVTPIDLSNSNTIDSTTIEIQTPAIEITTNDLANNSSIDTLSISQTHLIITNELNNSSTSDNSSITQTHIVHTNDTANGSNIDNATITQTHLTNPADASNGSIIEQTSISQTHVVVPSDISNESTIDSTSISLDVAVNVIPNNLSNQSAIDETIVNVIVYIAVENITNQSEIDNTLINQTHNIIVNDLYNQSIIDSSLIEIDALFVLSGLSYIYNKYIKNSYISKQLVTQSDITKTVLEKSAIAKQIKEMSTISNIIKNE